MASFQPRSGEFVSSHCAGSSSSKRRKLAEFGPSMIKSKISPRMLGEVRAHYRFPSGCVVSAPRDDERINNPPRDSFGLYIDHLKVGLRFPLHPFFSKIFELYLVVPGQLTPNSIQTICAFVIMCHIVDIEPTTSLFKTFFILKRDTRGLGWWMFGPCPDRKIVKGLPSTIHGWKEAFFFVSTSVPGDLELIWVLPNLEPNEMKTVDSADLEGYERLKSLKPPPIKELLSEKSLHLVSISGFKDLGTCFSLVIVFSPPFFLF